MLINHKYRLLMPNHDININFAVLFDATPVASLLCAENGNILLANQAAEKLLQFSATELQDNAIQALVPDFKLPTSGVLLNLHGFSYQASIMHHGKPQPVSVQCTTVRNEAHVFLLITILNDRRKQAEYALQNILQTALPSTQGMSEQSKLAALTGREREVMSLAIAGYHNKEIARALGISHRTVEIHKSRIMHKTGASNLLELARIASISKLMVAA